MLSLSARRKQKKTPKRFCRWSMLQFQKQQERKTKMSKIKNALDEILNCQICEGSGISAGWVSADGDYDFEWCECNPHNLIPDLED
jgi:hypothetical protein